MTDEQAVRLLRPLQEEPDAPSRIDLPRVMAEGRKRRMLRRWSGGVALIALTSVTAGGGTLAMSALRDGTPLPEPTVAVSVTPSDPTAAPAAVPAAPTACRVARLPTDGVRKALVTAGDPSGRYHAGRLYQSATTPIIWRDGKILARPRLSGDDPRFSDINSSGVAVGSAYLGGERQQAYVYRDGRVTELNGRHTAAVAINDAGVIAGLIGEVLAEVPARWSSAGAEVAKLPLPPGYVTGTATGVAENGTIVGGVSKGATDVDTAYLWSPDGTGHLLPLPTVEGVRATAFWAESINDEWVAGRAVFDSGTDGSRRFQAMRYRIADRSYQNLPVNSFPALLAGNDRTLLGSLRDGPVIVSGSTVTKLPPYRDLKEYEVTSISTDGRVITGYTTDSNGDQVGNEPLIWTCE